jgi:hypothetical protein
MFIFNGSAIIGTVVSNFPFSQKNSLVYIDNPWCKHFPLGTLAHRERYCFASKVLEERHLFARYGARRRLSVNSCETICAPFKRSKGPYNNSGGRIC